VLLISFWSGNSSSSSRHLKPWGKEQELHSFVFVFVETVEIMYDMITETSCFRCLLFILCLLSSLRNSKLWKEIITVNFLSLN
jgi:hypothetical protein